MIKNIIIAFFSVLSFSLPSFAQSFSLDSVRAASLPAAAAPAVPQAAPQRAEPRDWTIMYYSSAKDSKLRRSVLVQMLLMKNAGANARVNVVAEVPFATQDAAGAVSTVTARLAIGEPWDMEKVKQVGGLAFTDGGYVNPAFLDAFGSDVLSREANADNGDWKRAAAFMQWARQNYPAKHYVFMIYGHGNGFFDYAKKPSAAKSTLEDEDSGNYVTVPEMRLMMAAAGHVDLFVMQSCLMQSAEVTWEMKDYADVIVGSSELLWSTGYPVGDMIRQLGDTPEMPAAELGGMLADAYVGVLPSIKKTGQSSVVVTAKFDGFASRLNAWVDAVMAVKNRELLFPALRRVTRFDIFGQTTTAQPQFARNISISGDLYDLVKLTGETLPDDLPQTAAIKAAGAELMAYISGELVYKHAYLGVSVTGFDLANAGGLSARMPSLKAFDPTTPTGRGGTDPYYGLPFVTETHWGAFLNWLYNPQPAN